MWRHLLLNGRLWEFTPQKVSIKSIAGHASGTNRPIRRLPWFFPSRRTTGTFPTASGFLDGSCLFRSIGVSAVGFRAFRRLLHSYGFHSHVNHSKEFLCLLRDHIHICVVICLPNFCVFADKWKRKDLAVAHEIRHGLHLYRADFNLPCDELTCCSALKGKRIIVSSNLDFPHLNSVNPV